MLVLSSEEAGHETSTGIYRVIVACGERCGVSGVLTGSCSGAYLNLLVPE